MSKLRFKQLSNVILISGVVVIFVAIPLTVLLVRTVQEPVGKSNAQISNLPPLPSRWPTTLQLGMHDENVSGNAAKMKQTAPFGFRYKYITYGWEGWQSPAGQFATSYIQDSANAGINPVFTLYALCQAPPSNGCRGTMSDEQQETFDNLQSVSSMTAYYNNLKLFFQKAAAFPNQMVVLHLEPDVWGNMQQRSTSDNATTVPAQVSTTGIAELAGLPNNFSGYARAIVKLRDTYAPNVVLGYHLNVWGSGNDIFLSNTSDSQTDALATRSANFFNSLAANIDIVIGETSDRDAAFKYYNYWASTEQWWNDADYARHLRFLTKLSTVTNRRIVLWQIPYGNTLMRSQNNTSWHYQDNHVEKYLYEPSRALLNSYINAGVIGLLFGGGASLVTWPNDANNDGVTNPASITPPPGSINPNPNTMSSELAASGTAPTLVNNVLRTPFAADDDGGFFRWRAREYYNTGAMPLTTTTGPKTGDVNNDNSVNSADLAILISTWGSTTDLRADINKDGRVTSSDLALLISNWGR